MGDDKETTLELIKSVPLFGVDDEETDEDNKFVEEIWKRLKKVDYKAGDFVVKKDEVGDSMFYVLDGQMEMLYSDKTRTISEDPEYSFGEISLIYSTKRSASIRAKTNCKTFVLDKERFDQVMEMFPDRQAIVETIAKEKYSPQEQARRREEADKMEEQRKRELNSTTRKVQIDEALEDVEAELRALEAELAGRTMEGKDVYKFANGDTYDGEWHENSMHGQGVYTYAKTGNTYEGQWANNRKHGKGVLTNKQTGGVYHGDWVDGWRHGTGVFVDEHGSQYEGDWVKGVMQGKGVYAFADGHSYSGQFDKNAFNGRGTFNYSNGDKYEGAWVDGMQHGNGKLTTIEGHVYDGEWVKDQKSGQGTYKCTEFEYTGTWKESYFQGKGKYTYSNGDTYEGEWKEDKEEGTGKYVTSDASCEYTGEWRNGMKHGKGVQQVTDGTYDGEWKEDWQCGKGKYEFKSGASYDGEWEGGQMHGKGLYQYKNGKKANVVYHYGDCKEKNAVE